MKTPAGHSPLETGALTLVRTLRDTGYEAVWAGGCVRDRLLGRVAKDIDIVTSATPDEVASCFTQARPIGKAFGVMGVPCHDYFYEVATFREESGYADGRHPDTVRFASMQQDAQRRDFTINALFYDPLEDRVLDFVHGQSDLQAGIIRAVGVPDRRFEEDHLRLLRAIRFAGTLAFTIEPETWASIQRNASRIARISAERIREELVRAWCESPHPGAVLDALRDSGLLHEILPEVAALEGVEQPPAFHPEGDVYTHTRLMLEACPPPPRDPRLVFAVLLHDIGKPGTAHRGPGADGIPRIRFDGHDAMGAEMADALLKRLRFPNAFREEVVISVRRHMRFMQVAEMRRAKLRRWMAEPVFPLELELHRLDCLGSSGQLDHYHAVRHYQESLAHTPALPPRLITGRDLLTWGIPAGPAIGHWLKWARDEQLENPAYTRDDLLEGLRLHIKDLQVQTSTRQE